MRIEQVRQEVEDGTMDGVGGVKDIITVVSVEQLLHTSVIVPLIIDNIRARIVLSGIEFKKIMQLIGD